MSDETWPLKYVGLFCDCGCDEEVAADIRADTRDEAFAGLRRYAASLGWKITDGPDGVDLAPGHRDPFAASELSGQSEADQ